MTAQISDTVIYQGRKFSLAGINGDDLFDPEQIGLEVMMISTACWAGFYCTYTIKDDCLLLTKLTVGLTGDDREAAERGDGPIHFGVHPRRDRLSSSQYDPQTKEWAPHTYWSDWYYDLAYPIEFSGELTIGTDFIQELYVHMGFHPAYKYREVHELVFEAGRLQSAQDCSERMARIREMDDDDPLAPLPLPDHSDKEGIRKWIAETFNRRKKH